MDFSPLHLQQNLFLNVKNLFWHTQYSSLLLPMAETTLIMYSGNNQQAAHNNAGAQAQQQRPPRVQHLFPPVSSPYHEDRRHESHVGETAPILTFGPVPPNIPAQQQPSQQAHVAQSGCSYQQQQPQMNQGSNASATNVAYYDPTTKIYCAELDTPWGSIERIGIIREEPETSQPAKQPSPSSVPKKKKEKKLSKRPADRDDQPRKKP
ncbi:dce205b9-5fdd-401f-b238-229d6d784739 [Sclerotinia trifoliorum]|uniref:Dce205b9-5fdd-401f-b238-229d6d784739 n=1 Tax=Sclerotinia trifoliorum TaxID=28548 RepID=A0A8H2VLG5_9HELO|nr:dce205b9-5fdd-401f-b238-229d6d784739 [Sclerotinia trifoliorum]